MSSLNGLQEAKQLVDTMLNRVRTSKVPTAPVSPLLPPPSSKIQSAVQKTIVVDYELDSQQRSVALVSPGHAGDTDTIAGLPAYKGSYIQQFERNMMQLTQFPPTGTSEALKDETEVNNNFLCTSTTDIGHPSYRTTEEKTGSIYNYKKGESVWVRVDTHDSGGDQLKLGSKNPKLGLNKLHKATPELPDSTPVNLPSSSKEKGCTKKAMENSNNELTIKNSNKHVAMDKSSSIDKYQKDNRVWVPVVQHEANNGHQLKLKLKLSCRNPEQGLDKLHKPTPELPASTPVNLPSSREEDCAIEHSIDYTTAKRLGPLVSSINKNEGKSASGGVDESFKDVEDYSDDEDGPIVETDIDDVFEKKTDNIRRPSSQKATESPLTKADKTANRKLNKGTFPKRNPHNINFYDEDGQALDIGSVEYLNRFAKRHKVTAETERKYIRQWEQFLSFSQRNSDEGSTVKEDILSSSLPTGKVCNLLCEYLNDRCNLKIFRESGIIVPLDTSTQELYWFAMSFMFTKLTNYKISTDEDFARARETHASCMRLAKEVAGLGQLSHQPLPLTKSQLLWLLTNDMLNLTTARGLYWLTFVLINLYFMPRVRTECKNITRGDFVRVRGPDGNVVGVLYVCQGTTKKDRGQVKAQDAAGYYKRPFAYVTAEDKLNFDKVFGVLEKQLDLLPHKGDRSTQKIFKSMRGVILPLDEPWLKAEDMGWGTYDSLLRTAIWACGLQVDQLQLANQALRPTIFCLHRRIGVQPSDTAANAGHRSENTQITYKRGDLAFSAAINEKVQEEIGGVVLERPKTEFVRLTDGRVMLPRPFAKAINNPNPGAADFLPLGSMELDQYYKYVPGEDGSVPECPVLPLNPLLPPATAEPLPSTSGIHLHSSWHVDNHSDQTATDGPVTKKARRESAPSSTLVSWSVKGKGRGKRSF